MRANLVMAAALSVVVCLLQGPAIAHADSLEEIFARANAAYFRGDYDDAARDYQQLVDLGVVDADVTYNLGSAEARRGRYGAAVQFFERTLWLRPGDSDAHAGLEAARAALGRQRAERMGEAEVDTAPPLSEALFGGIGRDALAVITIVAELGLFGALIALLFVRKESARLALGIAAPSFLVLGLVVGTGWALRSGALEEGDPGVVLVEPGALREGPDENAQERHRVHEGDRAWILARDRGWARVRVPEAGEGWISLDDIGSVRP